MKIHTPARLALLASLLATPALAQDQDPGLEYIRSNTRGFTLGAHVGAATVQLDGEDTGEAERGFGGGVTLGYGINDHITLLARVNAASIAYADDEDEKFTLSHLDLGGRYSFGTPFQPLRPFLELSLQGVGVSDEIEGSDVRLSGGAIGFAGGLEYFLNPNLGLEAALAVSKGILSQAEVDGVEVEDPDEDFTTTRLNIGFNWHP